MPAYLHLKRILPMLIFSMLLFPLLNANAFAAKTNPTASPFQQALALSPDLQAGKKIYALCAACHGDDGLGRQAGEFPSIAGQHQTVILKQLFDIQSKKRLNPTMFPFTDLETLGGLQGMADVAAYTATLKPSAANIQGDGSKLNRGAQLYQADCIACHGIQGQGNARDFYPRIRQQHYPYLVRELSWIKNKIRKNADPAMVALMQDYLEVDIQAVADYVSRLK